MMICLNYIDPKDYKIINITNLDLENNKDLDFLKKFIFKKQ